MSDFTNVVIYQPGGISNTILSTPVATAIKQKCSAATVTWICQEKLKDFLLSVCPYVDEVIEVPNDAGLDWKSTLTQSLSADLFIDLAHENSAGSLLQKVASLFLPTKTNSKCTNVSLSRNSPPNTHIVERYLETIISVGIPAPKNCFPTIFPEALKEKVIDPLLAQLGLKRDEPLVGLIPSVGANFSNRSWPSDGWCYLVRSVKENIGAKCLLIGGKDDVDNCRAIADELEDQCINLAGQLTLTDASALLKALALVIGSDCGALHMAVAADTPVIGLYGPTKSSERGPYGQEEFVLDQSGRCECFGKTLCMGSMPSSGNCMRTISLEEVMGKVYRVLDPANPPAAVRDSDNWFWSAKREQLR